MRKGLHNNDRTTSTDLPKRPAGKVAPSAGQVRGCAVCGVPLWSSASRYCSIECYRVVQRSVPIGPRFWSKVKKVAGGCWEWAAYRNVDTGYGQFMWAAKYGRNRPVNAHRVAWELTHGDPGDLFVLHKCDNPPCVNPDHLFIGTQLDNMRDAARKGRLSVPHSRKGVSA